MNYFTFAPHADREIAADKIQLYSRMAKEAILEYGGDAVINSTLGECLDDDGKLMVLPTVEKLLRQAPVYDLCAYAPTSGVPGFTEAVETALFGGKNGRFFVEAVPTPGSCGGLRHMVWNFLENGEKALTTEYHWGPYKSICEEHGRRLAVFKMFDESGHFNTEALREKAETILKEQSGLLLILNTPANNPTGYSMTKAEMESVMDVLRAFAEDHSRRITLCLDVTYIDFAGGFKESRSVFDALHDIPENMMITVLYSMSKSYTMCGMRCGAIACLSPDQEAAVRFRQLMSASSRAVWSNVVRLAQAVLVQVNGDPALRKQVEQERETFKQLIAGRAEVFMQEARKQGIKHCPYDHGYFITVLCDQPEETVKRLQKRRIYVVPVSGGFRFSPCALTEEKCRKAPEQIRQVLDEIRQEKN